MENRGMCFVPCASIAACSKNYHHHHRHHHHYHHRAIVDLVMRVPLASKCYFINFSLALFFPPLLAAFIVGRDSLGNREISLIIARSWINPGIYKWFNTPQKVVGIWQRQVSPSFSMPFPRAWLEEGRVKHKSWARELKKSFLLRFTDVQDLQVWQLLWYITLGFGTTWTLRWEWRGGLFY